MKRVVVTGYGIVSSIGNNKAEVLQSLKDSRSGIKINPAHVEKGFRSHLDGPIDLDYSDMIDRKAKRFMGPGAAYAFVALNEAIEQAGLPPESVSNERTGLVCGSGGMSTVNLVDAIDLQRTKGTKKIGPYMVPRTMSSCCSATIATFFKIKGVNYSISSACSTSAHCIGHASELIAFGKQDVVFAGGGEDVHWTMSMLFDAMGALSSKYNEAPQSASRPFDVDRDGFVISGGGGMMVLEEYEHAKKRGANIIAELVGYAATSDGYDMVLPSGEGAERCMKMATKDIKGPIQYINAHGTSTPLGDAQELKAIRNVFGTEIPKISSTKSLTGHALGAAGVNESIYSLLMLENDFIAGTANFRQLDDEVKDMPVVGENLNAKLNTVLSNSFGFGGTNASIVFSNQIDSL